MAVSTRQNHHTVQQVLVFLFWAFSISWVSWGLSTLLRGHIPIAPQLLIVVGVFAPAIGAKIVLRQSLKEMLHMISFVKRSSWRYLLLYTSLFTAVMVIWSQPLPGFDLLTVCMLFLYTTILTGGNEEVGWQGFLQPTLENVLPFPLATMLTGLIWAVWHMPLFLISGSSQNGVSFVVFATFCLLARFWIAVLHQKSQSVLCCILFHGLINTIGEAIFVGKGTENPFFFIGYSLMTLYSIYLWYRSERPVTK